VDEHHITHKIKFFWNHFNFVLLGISSMNPLHENSDEINRENQHNEGAHQIIYETYSQVLFSPMAPTKNGFGLQWKQWKPRHLELFEDGTLFYKKEKETKIKDLKFSLANKVLITLMSEEVKPEATPSDYDAQKVKAASEVERGMSVKCTTLEGFETYFRVIFTGNELERFIAAIQQVSKEVKFAKAKQLQGTPRESISPSSEAENEQQTSKKMKRFLPSLRKSKTNTKPTSVMRSTIASAMDQYDESTLHDRIVARRGALKWLPVFFSNDLIHGSWCVSPLLSPFKISSYLLFFSTYSRWFVIGSVMFVVSSLVMLMNSYHTVSIDMGSDDSGLTPSAFRATWVLMVLSGVFSTLG
jgi:hypothetical protein